MAAAKPAAAIIFFVEFTGHLPFSAFCATKGRVMSAALKIFAPPLKKAETSFPEILKIMN